MTDHKDFGNLQDALGIGSSEAMTSINEVVSPAAARPGSAPVEAPAVTSDPVVPESAATTGNDESKKTPRTLRRIRRRIMDTPEIFEDAREYVASPAPGQSAISGITSPRDEYDFSTAPATPELSVGGPSPGHSILLTPVHTRADLGVNKEPAIRDLQPEPETVVSGADQTAPATKGSEPVPAEQQPPTLDNIHSLPQTPASPNPAIEVLSKALSNAETTTEAPIEAPVGTEPTPIADTAAPDSTGGELRQDMSGPTSIGNAPEDIASEVAHAPEPEPGQAAAGKSVASEPELEQATAAGSEQEETVLNQGTKWLSNAERATEREGVGAGPGAEREFVGGKVDVVAHGEGEPEEKGPETDVETAPSKADEEDRAVPEEREEKGVEEGAEKEEVSKREAGEDRPGPIAEVKEKVQEKVQSAVEGVQAAAEEVQDKAQSATEKVQEKAQLVAEVKIEDIPPVKEIEPAGSGGLSHGHGPEGIAGEKEPRQADAESIKTGDLGPGKETEELRTSEKLKHEPAADTDEQQIQQPATPEEGKTGETGPAKETEPVSSAAEEPSEETRGPGPGFDADVQPEDAVFEKAGEVADAERAAAEKKPEVVGKAGTVPEEIEEEMRKQVDQPDLVAQLPGAWAEEAEAEEDVASEVPVEQVKDVTSVPSEQDLVPEPEVAIPEHAEVEPIQLQDASTSAARGLEEDVGANAAVDTEPAESEPHVEHLKDEDTEGTARPEVVSGIEGITPEEPKLEPEPKPEQAKHEDVVGAESKDVVSETEAAASEPPVVEQEQPAPTESKAVEGQDVQTPIDTTTTEPEPQHEHVKHDAGAVARDAVSEPQATTPEPAEPEPEKPVETRPEDVVEVAVEQAVSEAKTETPGAPVLESEQHTDGQVLKATEFEFKKDVVPKPQAAMLESSVAKSEQAGEEVPETTDTERNAGIESLEPGLKAEGHQDEDVAGPAKQELVPEPLPSVTGLAAVDVDHPEQQDDDHISASIDTTVKEQANLQAEEAPTANGAEPRAERAEEHTIGAAKEAEITESPGQQADVEVQGPRGPGPQPEPASHAEFEGVDDKVEIHTVDSVSKDVEQEAVSNTKDVASELSGESLPAVKEVEEFPALSDVSKAKSPDDGVSEQPVTALALADTTYAEALKDDFDEGVKEPPASPAEAPTEALTEADASAPHGEAPKEDLDERIEVPATVPAETGSSEPESSEHDATEGKAKEEHVNEPNVTDADEVLGPEHHAPSVTNTSETEVPGQDAGENTAKEETVTELNVADVAEFPIVEHGDTGENKEGLPSVSAMPEISYAETLKHGVDDSAKTQSITAPAETNQSEIKGPAPDASEVPNEGLMEEPTAAPEAVTTPITHDATAEAEAEKPISAPTLPETSYAEALKHDLGDEVKDNSTATSDVTGQVEAKGHEQEASEEVEKEPIEEQAVSDAVESPAPQQNVGAETKQVADTVPSPADTDQTEPQKHGIAEEIAEEPAAESTPAGTELVGEEIKEELSTAPAPTHVTYAEALNQDVDIDGKEHSAAEPTLAEAEPGLPEEAGHEGPSEETRTAPASADAGEAMETSEHGTAEAEKGSVAGPTAANPAQPKQPAEATADTEVGTETVAIPAPTETTYAETLRHNLDEGVKEQSITEPAAAEASVQAGPEHEFGEAKDEFPAAPTVTNRVEPEQPEEAVGHEMEEGTSIGPAEITYAEAVKEGLDENVEEQAVPKPTVVSTDGLEQDTARAAEEPITAPTGTVKEAAEEPEEPALTGDTAREMPETAVNEVTEETVTAPTEVGASEVELVVEEKPAEEETVVQVHAEEELVEKGPKEQSVLEAIETEAPEQEEESPEESITASPATELVGTESPGKDVEEEAVKPVKEPIVVDETSESAVDETSVARPGDLVGMSDGAKPEANVDVEAEFPSGTSGEEPSGKPEIEAGEPVMELSSIKSEVREPEPGRDEKQEAETQGTTQRPRENAAVDKTKGVEPEVTQEQLARESVVQTNGIGGSYAVDREPNMRPDQGAANKSTGREAGTKAEPSSEVEVESHKPVDVCAKPEAPEHHPAPPVEEPRPTPAEADIQLPSAAEVPIAHPAPERPVSSPKPAPPPTFTEPKQQASPVPTPSPPKQVPARTQTTDKDTNTTSPPKLPPSSNPPYPQPAYKKPTTGHRRTATATSTAGYLGIGLREPRFTGVGLRRALGDVTSRRLSLPLHRVLDQETLGELAKVGRGGDEGKREGAEANSGSQVKDKTTAAAMEERAVKNGNGEGDGDGGGVQSVMNKVMMLVAGAAVIGKIFG
ncbi:hypothetical protein N0V88_004125 [Collariella sp. IMI 366227]|nr:hypothetical protein N0V88_004125 [Collariella sp. IMI 366227]